MRFKLTFSCEQPQRVPINYQYPLSAWIYKVFNRADPAFAHWLHEHGYAFNGNRKFKLFTFSHLQGDTRFIRETTDLEVKREVFLTVSFRMDDAAASFISGLFMNQQVEIADRRTRGQFYVTSVQRMAEPDFPEEVAIIRTLSPIVLSAPRFEGGKLRAEYLHPDDERYSDLLKENLLKKYAAAHAVVVGVEHEGAYEEALADVPDMSNWHFKVMSEPRSRLQRIKEGTENETAVRGYDFVFRLSAPKELLAFGYEAGFGEKGSLGFGSVELLVTEDTNEQRIVNRRKDEE